MDDHGGNIYKYGKNTIDFSANINPLGLSGRLKNLLKDNLNAIAHYPDPDSKKLIIAVAKYWGIKEENILLGNGSSELIYLIASVFKPKNVFIHIPAFSEYERAARAVNTKVLFGHSLKDADMIFVCNPNNPTGSLVKIPKLEGLKIIDEAFMDFLPDENKYTMIRKTVKTKDNIVIRTLTKFFAIPGLRIGYIAAHKDTINRLKHNQPPWNINVLGQMIYPILKDKEYINKTRALVAKERDFLLQRLSVIPCLLPFNSVTNFILVKITGVNISAACLKEKLLQRGILIRDCSNFRGLNDRYFRVAVRTHNENLRLIAGLGQIL